MKKFFLMISFSLFCLVYLANFSLAASYNWTDITGSLADTYTDLKSIVESSDGSIYVAIRTIGIEAGTVDKIMKYSNGSWSDVTGGLSLDEINVLLQGEDTRYVGGRKLVGEAILGKVWKYSHGTWEDISGSINSGPIYSIIESYDQVLYAGGYAKVWKYDGASWQDISGSLMTGDNLSEVRSLVEAWDGTIYAGGYNIGTHQAKVWKYATNAWTDITGSLNGSVIYSLTEANDRSIIAGGNGLSSDGKVWKYNGTSWSDITGTFRSGQINTVLSISDGSILAGGCATVACTEAVLGKYLNNFWTNGIGNLAGNSIKTLMQASDGKLYVGGLGSHVQIWQRVLTQEEKILTQEQNLKNGDKIYLIKALNEQSISGQDIKVRFVSLSTKLTKNKTFWIKLVKKTKYPLNYVNSSTRAVKKYWKLATNLNQYKKNKYKIKIVLKYTKAEFKALKKRNSSANKSNLYLKAKTEKGNWTSVTSLWNDASVKYDVKKRSFIVTYFTKFLQNKYYFGIMLK